MYKSRLPWWLRWQSVCLQFRRPRFDPWVRKIPWRRKWQPTPVLLPGKSHGQRSLVGYTPWGHKQSDTTEWLHFHFLSLCIKVETEKLKWWYRHIRLNNELMKLITEKERQKFKSVPEKGRESESQEKQGT